MDQELLRNVPIFAELTEADLEVLARLATRRRYPKDGVVFFENEEGSSFFMIVDGRIKVTILGDDGREIILSVLSGGDFFGEMALLDQGPRVATVTAASDMEVAVLDPREFVSLIEEHPAVARKVLKVMAGRLRNAEQSPIH